MSQKSLHKWDPKKVMAGRDLCQFGKLPNDRMVLGRKRVGGCAKRENLAQAEIMGMSMLEENVLESGRV